MGAEKRPSTAVADTRVDAGLRLQHRESGADSGAQKGPVGPERRQQGQGLFPASGDLAEEIQGKGHIAELGSHARPLTGVLGEAAALMAGQHAGGGATSGAVSQITGQRLVSARIAGVAEAQPRLSSPAPDRHRNGHGIRDHGRRSQPEIILSAAAWVCATRANHPLPK